MLKEKDINVPKVVQQIQKYTYDRKNKRNTVTVALISNRKKINRRRLFTQINVYRNIWNKTERKTKKTKI